MKGFFPEGFWENGRELTLSRLYEAKENEEILSAKALMCSPAHDLVVNLGAVKGIIPRNEGAEGIEEGRTRDIALISRVGKTVSFTVTDIVSGQNGEPLALLSRRNAQRKFRRHLNDNCRPGDVLDARITHMENFGAFCDIGCGTVALLPIDSVSVSRISHPADRFSVGDDIKVVLKSIDGDGKITVSHKELLGTWEENADCFSVGQTVSGIVRSVEDYGIFVELTPNLAGLAEPKEGVFVGQTAGVFIKNIVKEKMKVKLIIIDSFDGEYSPEIKYFYSGKRMERFDYSPENCPKKIFTEFVPNVSKTT